MQPQGEGCLAVGVPLLLIRACPLVCTLVDGISAVLDWLVAAVSTSMMLRKARLSPSFEKRKLACTRHALALAQLSRDFRQMSMSYVPRMASANVTS